MASDVSDNIVLYGYNTGQLLCCINRKEYGVVSLAFSPDSKVLAQGTQIAIGGPLVIFGDVNTGSEIGSIPAVDDHLAYYEDLGANYAVGWSVAHSPNGNILAIASTNGDVIFWDLRKEDRIAI